MATALGIVIRRGISTSNICHSKKNFRKFDLPNKRGTREFKERQRVKPDPNIPIDKRGTKDVGYKLGDRFITVPEMIPELIVPDLKNCQLKPYVSYQSTDVVQSEFRAADLFQAIYAPKIRQDFANGKLDENGQPLEPSEYEKLTAKEAKQNAEKTGCDLFTETIVREPEKEAKNTVYTEKHGGMI